MIYPQNLNSTQFGKVRPFSGFPVEVLPDFIKSVYLDVLSHTQAPDALIVSELLATISLSCQGSTNVRRPNGPEIACSAWFLMQANSGERKTAVENLVLSAIRELEEEWTKLYQQDLSDYEVEHLAWKTHEKGLLKAISKEAKNGKFNVNMSQELKEHKLIEPQKPRKRRLLYDDASPSAIKEGLSENGQSIGIFSDEAQSVFDGQAFRDMAMINTLWGGGTLTVDRTSSPSFVIRGARLTMSLMVQPVIMQKFIEKKGEEARGTGLFARFLICDPVSTQGFRQIDQFEKPSQNLSLFKSKIKSIINSGEKVSDSNEGKRVVLNLSAEAALHWVIVYNEIESEMGFGASMFEIKDYASKLAENILRVAALFHVIESREGEISLEILQRAIVICNWYKEEFKKMFVPIPKLPESKINAMLLEDWLGKYGFRINCQIVPKQTIRRFGPSKLRDRVKLDAAIDELETQGKIFRYLGDSNGNPVPSGRTEHVYFSNIFSEYMSRYNQNVLNSGKPFRY